MSTKISQDETPKVQRLCVVAGKSGGHLIPALILAQKWYNQKQEGEARAITLFTTLSTLEERISSTYSCVETLISLSMDNFPYKNILAYPQFIWQFFSVLFSTFSYFGRHRPEYLISTGGYPAIPIVLAARMRRIPVDLYELNVIPGKAIMLLTPYARKIYITFSKTRHYFKSKVKEKCFLTDYPLRYEQSNIDTHTFNKEMILQILNTRLSFYYHRQQITSPNPGLILTSFDINRKTIFVLGGSQGSLQLSRIFTSLLEDEKELWPSIQVIHQTGAKEKKDWFTWYLERNIPAHVFPFSHDLHDFYSIADLVVARAGAGTLFELEFFKKKSLIAPLTAKTTLHQVANAQEMRLKHPQLFILYTASTKLTPLLFADAHHPRLSSTKKPL